MKVEGSFVRFQSIQVSWANLKVYAALYKVKLAMVGETIRLKIIKSIEEYQSNLELKILCLDHRLTDVGKVYSNIS